MAPDHEELTDFIRSTATSALGLPAMIGADDDLFELGMDSIDAVELTATIETRFHVVVDPTLAFEEATARNIATAICALGD